MHQHLGADHAAMCVGGPRPRLTFVAPSKASLSGRLRKPAPLIEELKEQVHFEAEAERNLQLFERGRRVRQDDGIVGPLNADGTKIAVRHGSKIGMVCSNSAVDCLGTWSRSWQAARSAAVAGDWKQRELTQVTPVSEEELTYASSKQSSTCDDRECSPETPSWSVDDSTDDLIEQIKEMALWVSEPGRMLVVSG